MKKMLFLLIGCLFLLFAISGCAGMQENSGGEYEKPSGYSGHHH